MLMQTIFALGLCYLCPFTPFFKDPKGGYPNLNPALVLATPIIYLSDMVADRYPAILEFNPFYHFVKLYQDIFLYSKAPAIKDFLLIGSISIITLLVAIYLYKKMVSTIKDII